MSLLYQPINMTPSNSTIDATKNNNFSLTIRGTICVGYQLTIYNNSTGASVYTPAKVDISAAPLYDGDILTISVPAASGGSGMSNGNQYKWSIDLYYDETDHITSREVVFNAYSTPTVSIPNPEHLSTINRQSYEFVLNYSQAEDVPVASFVANLYSWNPTKLLRSSGTIYSANVRYTFDGFVGDGRAYGVEFIVTNQAGVTVTSAIRWFYVSYPKPSLNITPTAINSADTACVLINWGGAYQNVGQSTGEISYVSNHLGGKFLRLEEDATAYWDIDIPTNFTSTFLFTPFEAQSERLYLCDGVLNKLYQLSTNTLTSINSDGINAPGSRPVGMGGTKDRLFTISLDNEKFYEIDPVTLVNLSGAGVTTPGSRPSGVGGTNNRLFHCDRDTMKLYEIDPGTFANLSGAGVDSPGSDPSGIGGLNERLFHCDSGNNRLYELDPDTLANMSGAGTIIEDFVPADIGGMRERLFCVGNDDYESTIVEQRLYVCNVYRLMYELDPDTLANLSGNGVSAPDSYPWGIGGISDSLYVCTGGRDKIYRLDIDTLANLSGSGVSTPGENPRGVGGIYNRIFSCDDPNTGPSYLYEHNPDTLANLSGSGVTSPGGFASGIGGTSNTLCHCDGNTDKLYIIDPDTLANLSGSGVNAPSTTTSGIGGMNDRLYCCDYDVNKLYELDPDTLANLSGVGVNAPATLVTGIGGTKGVADFLGRIYEIDPDTLTPIGEGVLTPGLNPSGIGGVKYFEYAGFSLSPIFELSNSGTSDYLRLVFKTDLTNDYFYIQFNGHSVLFNIFDAIDVNDGVYFVAITPKYVTIKQWSYSRQQ